MSKGVSGRYNSKDQGTLLICLCLLHWFCMFVIMFRLTGPDGASYSITLRCLISGAACRPTHPISILGPSTTRLVCLISALILFYACLLSKCPLSLLNLVIWRPLLAFSCQNESLSKTLLRGSIEVFDRYQPFLFLPDGKYLAEEDRTAQRSTQVLNSKI